MDFTEDLSSISIQNINCPANKLAKMVCSNPKCQKPGLLCLSPTCDICENNHQFCRVFRVNTLIQKVKTKKQPITDQVISAYNKINEIFNQITTKIQKQKLKLKQKINYFGLTDDEIYLIEKLKDGKRSEINGKLVSRIIPQLNYTRQVGIILQDIQAFWKTKKFDIETKFQYISSLVNFSKFFCSKITYKQKIIQGFFKDPIEDFKLLYRASENKFGVHQFHTKCDKIPYTLILARTQFGNIIGGYCDNFMWTNTFAQMTDKKSKTFLFSITNNEKYPFLMKKKKKKCLVCSPLLGPTFGSDFDFKIEDNANISKCTFKIGQNYHIANSSSIENYERFSGSKTGQCRLTQWQVFQVIFKKTNQIYQ